MFTCSNPQCRKQYNPDQADVVKGDCTNVLKSGKVCGAPLADQDGKGWKWLQAQKPPAPPKPPAPAAPPTLLNKPAPNPVQLKPPAPPAAATKPVTNPPTPTKPAVNS